MAKSAKERQREYRARLHEKKIRQYYYTLTNDEKAFMDECLKKFREDRETSTSKQKATYDWGL